MIFCPLSGRLNQDFRLVQGFYDRPEYYAKYGLKAHSGYDLCPMVPGTPGMIVYAPHDGVLSQLDFGKNGYGKHVQISDRMNGRMTTLAHFERFYSLPAGGKVFQGDPVGVMGMTGDADGIHLHLDYCHIDWQGNILNDNNGYHGRVPCAQYIRLWYPDPLGAPGT